MNRFQITAIAAAIGRRESREFGDCLTVQTITDIIQTEARALEYYHLNPLDALKQAESALVDVINLIDQANDDRSYTKLGKQADALMVELQREIRYAETPVEDRG